MDTVWPLVKQKISTAKLTIVGAFPPLEIRQYAKSPDITVTGAVPDLRPYYARARLVVAPIFVAGLAAGRPVVATSIANRGVDAPCVSIADTPDRFADVIIQLLEDRQLWLKQALASRAYALANFDWPAAVEALESRLTSLVAEKHRHKQPE
jgi:polysaccharide biosynthesis protein PslH